jgi:hypothetical protein
LDIGFLRALLGDDGRVDLCAMHLVEDQCFFFIVGFKDLDSFSF